MKRLDQGGSPSGEFEFESWLAEDTRRMIDKLGGVRASDLDGVVPQDGRAAPRVSRESPVEELQEWWAEEGERRLALLERVRSSVAQRGERDGGNGNGRANAVAERPPASRRPERRAAALFDEGIHGAHVEAFREEVRDFVKRELVPLVARAEADRRFPRAAIEAMGRAGYMRARWAGGGHGDVGRAVILGEEAGYAGLGGIGVGISLHMEAVTATLTRFAKTDPAVRAREGALDGTLVGCMATTERDTGSDLTSLETTMTPTRDGRWHVEGRKWFVSPGAAADFALILCRTDDRDAERTGRIAPMGLVLVPRDGLHIEHTIQTVGMRGLGTARVTVDAKVDKDHVIGKPGTALLLASWGLTHERIGIAAGVIGAARLAIALATTHLKRRRQFGVRLYDHQALRLRLADLQAQVEVARNGLYALAAQFHTLPEHGLRQSAAMKVTTVRLGHRVIDECMHFFGGTGYVEGETPLARLWRDLRVGRLGAGSDEMMWELVAGGLSGDDAAYDALMELYQ